MIANIELKKYEDTGLEYMEIKTKKFFVSISEFGAVYSTFPNKEGKTMRLYLEEGSEPSLIATQYDWE